MSQTNSKLLFNNKVRTVELHVENLLWGTIAADFIKLREEGLSDNMTIRNYMYSRHGI
jgi:hypothetical protein